MKKLISISFFLKKFQLDFFTPPFEILKRSKIDKKYNLEIF